MEHLPVELQRNFTLMRDLDTRAQNLMRTIDSLADQYLRNVNTMSLEKRKEQMECIQSQFNKAKEYGDDKVQLAIQTYELVDKHIRRLDSDLARFEAEIQDKALSKTHTDDLSSQKSMKTKYHVFYKIIFHIYINQYCNLYYFLKKVGKKPKMVKNLGKKEGKEHLVKKKPKQERNKRKVVLVAVVVKEVQMLLH